MEVEPGVTEIGRRGLDLDGWGDLSVWGWDSQAGTLFAQLWRDRADEDDEDDDKGPDIWITPPTWEATGTLVVLARRIADATASPIAVVLMAMAQSAPGGLSDTLMAQVRAD
jgi:hypothetical protein